MDGASILDEADCGGLHLATPLSGGRGRLQGFTWSFSSPVGRRWVSFLVGSRVCRESAPLLRFGGIPFYDAGFVLVPALDFCASVGSFRILLSSTFLPGFFFYSFLGFFCSPVDGIMGSLLSE